MSAIELKRLLKRAGMSQRGAARELGINERTMRLYVAGDAIIPTTVALACKYLWGNVNVKN